MYTFSEIQYWEHYFKSIQKSFSIPPFPARPDVIFLYSKYLHMVLKYLPVTASNYFTSFCHTKVCTEVYMGS